VLSAYCPHTGADLAAGKVVGSRTCAASREYDGGVCRKLYSDPPPKNARLFRFPRRKFGLVWVSTATSPGGRS
jgi:nitrite reductase/ring-hydroxylating ferredoxin subunit